MKIVEQTAGRLILQEKPWLVLFVGGLFVIAGIVVALKADSVPAGIGSALLGAIVILAFGNTVTATFDSNVGRFTRKVRGVVRNGETTHQLSEIAGVTVETSRASRGSPSYRIALVLTSGKPVPLTTSYSSGKSAKEQSAAAIRQFLNLPAAPEIKIPGFRDMVGMMFDPNPAQRMGEMFSGPTAEYEAQVRRDPANLEARRQLGLALAMQGKAREASEHLEAARDLAAQRGNPALAGEIDEMLRRMNDATGRS